MSRGTTNTTKLRQIEWNICWLVNVGLCLFSMSKSWHFFKICSKVSGIKNAGTQPKMQVLNLVRLFLGGGWVFPYISRIHTAYIGEDEPSILGTNEMFGDLFLFAFFNTFSPVERWECLGKMTGAHEIPCRQNFEISSETTLGL